MSVNGKLPAGIDESLARQMHAVWMAGHTFTRIAARFGVGRDAAYRAVRWVKEQP